MAVSWVRSQPISSQQQALDELLAISRWQQENYQTARDTSARDTAERIFRGYFNHQSVQTQTISHPDEIIQALMTGALVITPMNGQIIGNPYYTQPGPERHMIVIRGYDPQTQEFITNDPGTRRGEGYRYDQWVFWQAIRDYPTGDHEPITEINRSMIVVAK
jgi:hypothetical protein